MAYSVSRPLLQVGALEEGIAALSLACARKPRVPKYQLERASALLRASRYAEALEAFQLAGRLTQGDFRPVIGQAEALTRLGRASEGRAAMDLAAQMNAPAPALLRVQRILKQKST